jgi:hypothetical protein
MSVKNHVNAKRVLYAVVAIGVSTEGDELGFWYDGLPALRLELLRKVVEQSKLTV